KEYPPILYIHKPRGRCTGHKRQCSGFLFVRNRCGKRAGMDLFSPYPYNILAENIKISKILL
ncbi:MAG: hypothetical protein IKF59_03465, partial [Lachnospiraceae bacterium]|nr:hypothetical protein [Lachnospiraceae bacterium]